MDTQGEVIVVQKHGQAARANTHKCLQTECSGLGVRDPRGSRYNGRGCGRAQRTAREVGCKATAQGAGRGCKERDNRD